MESKIKTKEESDIAGDIILKALSGFQSRQAKSILKWAIEKIDDESIVV